MVRKTGLRYIMVGCVMLLAVLLACGNTPLPEATAGPPTATRVPTATSGAAATQADSAPPTQPQAAPTNAQASGATQAPSTSAPGVAGFAATATACPYDASYDKDVTIPDDTAMDPGETFEKVWRVVSDGCQAWPEGTTLYFERGDKMGAPDRVNVPVIAVGQTTDIKVNMTAPTTPGTYRGTWNFITPDGIKFGSHIYVQIVVGGPDVGLMPDLIVSDYSYSLSAGTGGETQVAVSATVKNVGTGAAGPSHIGISLKNAGAGAPVPVMALNAGQSVTVQFGFTVDPGPYTIEYVADIDSEVTETVENNNVQQQQFTAK